MLFMSVLDFYSRADVQVNIKRQRMTRDLRAVPQTETPMQDIRDVANLIETSCLGFASLEDMLTNHPDVDLLYTLRSILYKFMSKGYAMRTRTPVKVDLDRMEIVEHLVK